MVSVMWTMREFFDDVSFFTIISLKTVHMVCEFNYPVQYNMQKCHKTAGPVDALCN